MRELFDQEEIFQSFMRSEAAYARKEGRAQGIAEGIAEGRAEGIEIILSKLRALGVDESLLRQAETQPI